MEVVELVGFAVGATDFGGGVACFEGRTEDFSGAVTGALVVEAAAGILVLGPGVNGKFDLVRSRLKAVTIGGALWALFTIYRRSGSHGAWSKRWKRQLARFGVILVISGR